MGLAASQARFLGITLRKANCEFKSTQLAEQKLQISNQLADVSQEYSNAMQSTKLLWCNDACTADYGLSYGLIMMPSAVNDYNPYMITSKSGAIILNANYAAAAKAAGIGMNGGIATAAGRDKFIQTLSATGVGLTDIYGQPVLDVNGQQKKIDIGLATAETTDRILNGLGNEPKVEWNISAGMGAAPEDKGVQDAVTLADLINNARIGGAKLDWLQMYTKDGVYTENEWDIITEDYTNQLTEAKNIYLSSTNPPHTTTDLYGTTGSGGLIGTLDGLTEYMQSLPEDYDITNFNLDFNDGEGKSNTEKQIINQFRKLEYMIDYGVNSTEQNEAKKQYELLKQGKNPDGKDYADPGKYAVIWAYYDEYAHKPDAYILRWANTTDERIIGTEHGASYLDRKSVANGSPNDGGYPKYDLTTKKEIIKDDDGNTIDEKIVKDLGLNIGDVFQTEKSEIENYTPHDVNDKNVIDDVRTPIHTKDGYQMTVITNGVITTNESNLKDMTVADLFKNDVVIMNWWRETSGNQDAIEEMSYRVTKLMEYIAGIFGYGNIGTGLNVDETTNQALEMALIMVEKKFLKPGSAVFLRNSWNKNSVADCSAYQNANNYNRIGSDSDKNTAAVNLSNMVSAFLTYFDNYLRGNESEYTVGKANDENDDSKTYFVTDDPTYVYITNTPGQMSLTQKIADFYDMLYNNLCAHGWREDGSVDQSEYLESMIKDGRYQMMSLNEDGYFYQTRYNHTGYMKEVTDEDKITRAEAAYTKKKAELTYKEDAIDVKAKKLDAEIAELSTEINSVQNFISKSIEKTFAMFSS